MLLTVGVKVEKSLCAFNGTNNHKCKNKHGTLCPAVCVAASAFRFCCFLPVFVCFFSPFFFLLFFSCSFRRHNFIGLVRIFRPPSGSSTIRLAMHRILPSLDERALLAAATVVQRRQSSEQRAQSTRFALCALGLARPPLAALPLESALTFLFLSFAFLCVCALSSAYDRALIAPDRDAERIDPPTTPPAHAVFSLRHHPRLPTLGRISRIPPPTCRHTRSDQMDAGERHRMDSCPAAR